jgi:hypothetical protein
VIDLLLQTFTDKQMKYQIYLEVNANDELRELDPDAPYPEDEIAEDFHEWAFATGKDAARDTGRDRYSGRYLSEYFERFETEFQRVIVVPRPSLKHLLGRE